MTKGLVASAYKDEKAVTEEVSSVTGETALKALAKKLRSIFLNMQLPSTQYNAWTKNFATDRPVKIWNEADDTVLLIRNDVLSEMDVDVLASSFNMDKANFMGHRVLVDSFGSLDRERLDILFNGLVFRSKFFKRLGSVHAL